MMLVGEFDLSEYVGVGLTTNQLGYLAGILFCGFLAVSAIRRVSRAPGIWSIIWVNIAVGLIAGAAYLFMVGFPEQIPDELKPWATEDSLTHAGIVVALAATSLVFLSAHWIKSPLGRWVSRSISLGMLGTAVWMGAKWFGEPLPEEVREWTAQNILIRIGITLGLLFLAIAFWSNDRQSPPHRLWSRRLFTPLCIATAMLLSLHWFGEKLPEGIDRKQLQTIVTTVGGIATASCLLTAIGASLLQKRLAEPPASRPEKQPPPPAPKSQQPSLPVALHVDESGRPLPPSLSRD